MVVLSSEIRQPKQHSFFLPVLQSVYCPHQSLTNIHQEYGDLVMGKFFNKRLLFVSKPEHIEEVFAQEARGLLNRDFLYKAKHSLFGDGLINSKQEIWTKQRRLLQPLFVKEAVATWESVIRDTSTEFTHKLKEKAIDNVNLSNELRNLIQQIFIKILIGKPVDTLPDKDKLMAAVGVISRGLLWKMMSEIVSDGKLMKLMPAKNRRYQQAVNQLNQFVNREIALRHDKNGHDLISMMLKSKDTNTGYSMPPELLRDETVNLLFAGQDTTINTLSWFFYHIGKDKQVHEKITQEVLSFKDDEISSDNLAKLTYTKAALHETLRLFPSSPALATQTVTECVIGGYRIAERTTIILSTYVTQRSAALWSKPNTFYPEHFLNQQAGNRHKYAFFPFGGGLHNCIGRHFAELEMLIVIVTLLREFTFESRNTVKEAASITLKPDRDVIASVTTNKVNS
jgi:cytochrome P450